MYLTREEQREWYRLRKAQDAVLPHIANTPAAVNVATALIREWTPGVYIAGDVRQYDGIPYKCVPPGHDSTENPSWTPPTVPALWMQYHGTSVETARPYIQPQGAHDAYMEGEYVIADGKVYRCAIDGTVYPPSSLPGSWTAVSGQTDGEEPTEPIEPDEPDEPEPPTVGEWPAWVQPTGSHDAYNTGAQVTYNGKRWVSTADGNVWVPGVYGWTEVK